MNRICTVLALGVTLLLAGCVTSKNPIGETVGFKPDPALVGVWRASEDNKKDGPFATIYFLPKKDGGMSGVFVELPNGNDKGGWIAVDLKVASLGKNNFMNAREIAEDGEPAKEMPDYTLLLYRFSDVDTLTICQIDVQKIGDEVDSKRLAGKAEKNNLNKEEWDDVLITADSAALDAFMKRPEAAALFDEKPLILHRQKPPQ